MSERGLSRLPFCSADAEPCVRPVTQLCVRIHRNLYGGGQYRRDVKKQQLEILLQKVKVHPNPSANLEQYSTPASIAADVLWFAYAQGDIAGKKVVDLGCGTGILGIGAKLLGAEEVISLDVDEAALGVAMKNASALGAAPSRLTVDVKDFPEPADTASMNPPSGAEKSGRHEAMVV